MNNLRHSASKARSLTGGQTFMLGGAIVIASLSGFYFNLRRRQSHKEEKGTVPHYEHLLAHFGSSETSPGASELSRSRYEQRASPLPPIAKEHHNKHSTIPDFRLSAATAPENIKTNSRAHLEQPTPQRPKMAGSSLVYTKSPGYAQSYEKAFVAKPKSDSMAINGQTKENDDERKA